MRTHPDHDHRAERRRLTTGYTLTAALAIAIAVTGRLEGLDLWWQWAALIVALAPAVTLILWWVHAFERWVKWWENTADRGWRP